MNEQREFGVKEVHPTEIEAADKTLSANPADKLPYDERGDAGSGVTGGAWQGQAGDAVDTVAGEGFEQPLLIEKEGAGIENRPETYST